MYDPVPDGLDPTAEAVLYEEAAPPPHLGALVHRFWSLRTSAELRAPFLFHALPDACVNLLFNVADPDIAGITRLRTTATVLDLGRSFHYAGVQLFPGVWRGAPDDLRDSYVGTPYEGTLPLRGTAHAMRGLAFADQVDVMVRLIDWCVAAALVVPDPVTARILAHLDAITSVADMARLTGVSPRQLQRLLRRSTGLAPHDLLKVLRVQQSFRRHHLDLYADQSQFIHEFRRATGYTPGRFRARYGVRNPQDGGTAPR